MGQLKARVISVGAIPVMVAVGSENHAIKLVKRLTEEHPSSIISSVKVPIECQGCHKMKSFTKSFDKKVKREAARCVNENDDKLDRRAAALANRINHGCYLSSKTGGRTVSTASLRADQVAGVKVRRRAVSRKER